MVKNGNYKEEFLPVNWQSFAIGMARYCQLGGKTLPRLWQNSGNIQHTDLVVLPCGLDLRLMLSQLFAQLQRFVVGEAIKQCPEAVAVVHFAGVAKFVQQDIVD